MFVEEWEEMEWENGGKYGFCRRWDFRLFNFIIKIKKEFVVRVDGWEFWESVEEWWGGGRYI